MALDLRLPGFSILDGSRRSPSIGASTVSRTGRSTVGLPSQSQSGFTLIEILIVVAIIGVLSGFLTTGLICRGNDARIQLTQSKTRSLEQVIELYRAGNGRYPTSEQGLDALVREPTREPKPRRYPASGYARAAELVDAWAEAQRCSSPAVDPSRSFDLCSLGPDGVTRNGSEDSDDICSFHAFAGT